ncbi:dephospho-CoA kinase [Candidatus Pelagibacter sp.]|jgi:dephospho-CoA kinase|nr:dephospho-CoA kinase [Candidatus Pelagibacter sp.]|tara:strand:+ start:93 stop:662 length:570 start_codon:yes stop_codon:yes gene_type:complete
MIKIGILGDIGSGKSYVAKNFGYPVFNADVEVGKLYEKDRKIFNKLKKILPKYIYSFPINKNEISNAILANKSNLKRIGKIVHLEIRKKMIIFLRKNKKKKIVILDIPLLLENQINKKNDILVFVKSKKLEILKRLKKRKNFNPKLLNQFKNIQLPLDYKKKRAQFIIKNNFTKKSVKIGIKKIIREIL